MPPTDQPPPLPPSARSMCEHCGYPMEGLPSSGTCPECGKRYEPGGPVVTPLTIVGPHVALLGVPVWGAVVLIGGATVLPNVAYSFVGVGCLLCIAWMFVIPVHIRMLAKRHIPEKERPLGILRKSARLGWPILLTVLGSLLVCSVPVLGVVALAVALGACLISGTR